MAVRILIGIVMGGVILAIGIAWVRSMVNAPPPEPEPADVSDQGLRYVCTMCGLELAVQKAAREKAPTHCMEPMVLIRERGPRPPPLRSS